ncbi:MAG: hypothetical protein KME18_07655 [Phormidium tanganyikae FI6-MK23]|jgi:hypothetical protein|nr:hypothetical protein [Phormidium tanganyikae FI6-MK23]
MILDLAQDPTKVDLEVSNDSLLLAIDRGNSGSKIAVSVNGRPLEPFKVPSVIRKVDEGKGLLKVNAQTYLCGESAISMTVGTTSTPLGEGDKIKNLSVVIAQVVSKILESRPLTNSLDLRLIVSSPFCSAVLTREVEAEVKKLENGFHVGSREFRVSVKSVATEFEGTVLLKSAEAYNGVIDIGFGTILAGYRKSSGKVETTPLMGGDLGGCNLVINGLLSDPAFLAAVKKSGASAPPSAERLSAKLSEGQLKVRDIDLKPLLKPHLGVLKTRIEDAASAVATQLRLDSLASDNAASPKIALVGGGAALLQAVLGDNLKTWLSKYHLEFYDQPDYQTAVVMQQIAKLGGNN